jgi:magnesium chelatase accessory protein
MMTGTPHHHVLPRASASAPGPADRAASLVFEQDGRDWPNRAASRMVSAGGLTWHVQVMGEGPVALLVHGTGASTHSFAALMPLLARKFTVVSFDLPGHAFTGALPAHRMTLPEMSVAIGALLDTLGLKPEIAVGHSAGAAILIQLCLDGRIDPRVLISLNGALLSFQGLAGQIFSPLAKVLARNPLVPRLFAWRASDDRAFERLVSQTGSTLGPAEKGFYQRLSSNRGHIAAALAMMAGWDLDRLQRAYGRLRVPVVLVAGGRDTMVPPDQAFRAHDLIPGSQVVTLRRLGHLAHEESPGEIASVIETAAATHGVFGSAAA